MTEDIAKGAPAHALPGATTDYPAPAIRASGLTKVFGQRTCVDHLTFNVYPGELYALLGDNGAGKTTTINMLTTLLSPTAGEFHICGLNGLTEAEKLKELFGVVSQDVAIYQELTAYENLAFVAELYGMPRRPADARIAGLLDSAGLLERANDLAGEFSMGMQRKLAIATAILHEPKVLFMDEPTVGLDPGSRRHIWEMLKDLRAKGVTILLTTHYLEEAELIADRIGIIRRGKMVLEGTIGELRNRIQGISGVTVTLADRLDDNELKDKIDKLLLRLPTRVHHDPLRNTLAFAQPAASEPARYLREVLAWLEEEQIPMSKLATRQPSLEEVFLYVAAGKADLNDSAGGSGFSAPSEG